ncbi:MAG: hypothetical protein H5T59_12230 [Anaerolineae bacterium]|nr:hypothetical protein [Anaerolineae bacterium]
MVLYLAVYGALVVAYTVAVLQFLGQPLADLFHKDLRLYAAAALACILVQAVALASLTSFLLGRVDPSQRGTRQ